MTFQKGFAVLVDKCGLSKSIEIKFPPPKDIQLTIPQAAPWSPIQKLIPVEKKKFILDDVILNTAFYTEL